MKEKDSVQDELVLGMSMVINAWHLLEDDEDMACYTRNLCELGFNGSVWGPMAELVVDLMGKVMTRWISDREDDDEKYLTALRLGIKEGRHHRNGEEFTSCDKDFLDVCPLRKWNAFVQATKEKSRSQGTF